MENLDRNRDEPNSAMAKRLAMLRTMPVDTTRLEKMLKAKLPGPDRRFYMAWSRPVRAIAASVVIFALIGAILLASSGGPVLASPTQMAQFHYDMVQGSAPAMQVDSIAEANKMLTEESPHSPTLPAIVQHDVMACCMRSVKNKKVACVLLKSEGAAITMTVANAADMKLPAVASVSRNGTEYRVQSVGKLNMVMMQRSSRWICLIGEVPAERLMDIAATLKF